MVGVSTVTITTNRTFSQRDVSLGEETSVNLWVRVSDCMADGERLQRETHRFRFVIDVNILATQRSYNFL